MVGQKSNTHQRDLGYRAVIPFYILWDTDLNGNDLRFYGQIEQMESNPSPNVDASFSYQWIADMLGINRRNAINIANKLKKKGYITRTKINQKEYLWNTVKKGVLVSSSDTSLVSPSDTALVSSSDTQNTSKLKTNKENNISESDDSLPVIQDKKIVSNVEMINAFKQTFPNHPHPDIKKPDAALVINLNKLRKSWAKEISGSGKNLTLETFTNYLKNMIDIKHYMIDPEKNYEMVSFITLKTVKSVKAMVEAKQRRSV